MGKQTKKAKSKSKINPDYELPDLLRGPVPAWGIGLLLLVVVVWIVLRWLGWFDGRYEVYGQVTRTGKPIEMAECRITFLNIDKGIIAPATLDSDGKYRVFNYKESGLPAGDYKVVVSFPAEYLPPTDPKDPLKPLPPDELERQLGKFIPKRYRDPETSGLTLELKDADVEFDVDMTD